ncbi:MAG: hypothetical protein E6I59_09865 [Chloroflexi bacterium]|jgi:hypothetical protein|nr:MAG: hypothetical protein E6I97_01760 [Chloroflexota bacterium]TME62270.1 MAG: hypothetical protein E6I59_09865 [Chloroflexota bacterium]
MAEPFVVLDPTLEVEAAKVERAPRVAEVKRIGLLDNGKPNSEKVLQMVAAKVAEAYPGVQVTYYRKPGAYRPAPSALLDQVAEENDVALVGIGD